MSEREAQRILGRRLTAVLAAVFITGLAVFLYLAIAGGKPWSLRAWQAFLVNWLFWTGMATGGVVVAAVLDVTGSSWGRPLKRLAETFASFLPLSFLLFLALFPGMDILYPWIGDPVPGGEWWLRKGFLFGRDAVALLILYGASMVYVYSSVRPDLEAFRQEGPGAKLRAWWRRGWRGDREELEISRERLRLMAPAVIIIYAFVYSLLAYDLVMSLDPTWYSTLFGAYVFVINVFGALALVAVVAVLVKDRAGMGQAVGEPQFHDLGKLLFGFCLLSLDFFWSQFLVIWYGNLPEETGFLLVRAYGHPWKFLSWLAVFGGLVAPFILLLRRRMKADPKRLFAVSLWIVVMIWIERFVLVVPSTWPEASLPLGMVELAISVGFAALFALALAWALDRVPALPLSEEAHAEPVHHHVIGETDAI